MINLILTLVGVVVVPVTIILWIVEARKNGSLKATVTEVLEDFFNVFEEGCQYYVGKTYLENEVKFLTVDNEFLTEELTGQKAINAELVRQLERQEEISENWKQDSRNGWKAHVEALGVISDLTVQF